MPAHAWLEGPLSSWAEDRLVGPASRLEDRFRAGPMRLALDRARAGDRAAAEKVWVLIVLGYWLEAWT